MESLKSLLDGRNKAIHDARSILEREKSEGRALLSEEQAKADELLDVATDFDAKIEERKKSVSRNDRLNALSDRLNEDVGRQTPSSNPGLRPTGSDGAALSLKFGRHTLSLKQGTPEYERASAPYEANYANYLRGDYAGRRGHESLGLQTGDDTRGGYTAPAILEAGIIKFLDDMVFMRQLGTVLPPTTEKTLGHLSYDTDPGDADWTAEIPASDIAEDDAARFGKREMSPWLSTKLLKFSRKILRASHISIWDFMSARLGYKFGITEEKAFLSGTGVNQPLGVFTASNDGIDTSRDTTATGSAPTTSFVADDLLTALYSLKGQYQARSTWLLSREAVKRIRKFKDGVGQYLWQEMQMTGGQPGSLFSRPYVMSEYVPATYTTGLYVAAVGDMSHYWIQDSLGLEIQRLDELLALRNQVGMLARKETDAMPVLAEAFARLKLA